MSDHIDRELLIDYQFGLLEGEEKLSVDTHLKECKSCQDILKTVQVQFGQLDLIRDREEALADGLLESIAEMAKEHRPQSSPKAVIPWPGIILTAAACLAVAGLIFLNRPPALPEITVSDATLTKTDDNPLETATPSEQADAIEAIKRIEAVKERGAVLEKANAPVREAESAMVKEAHPEKKERLLQHNVRELKTGSQARGKGSKGKEKERSGLAARMKVDAKRAVVADTLMAPSSTKAANEGVGGRTADAMMVAKAPDTVTASVASSKPILELDQPYFEPGSNIELNVLPRRENLQLTIYNSEDLTLVRERRQLTLKKGWNWMQYMWKNTLIDPTSLELKPVGVGDKVTVTQLVFPPRMTGVGRWLVHSQVSGLVECEITYFTSGLHWRAFYEGTLSADETEMEFKSYVRIDNGSGETYDDAKTRLVVGMVSLHDMIEDLARRKHAYGRPASDGNGDMFFFAKNGPSDKLDLLEEAESSKMDDEFGDDDDDFGGLADPRGVMKEALSEYQLFTIEGRDTIPNKWGKRLRSMAPMKVPVKNLYKYDETMWGKSVVRYVSFKNDEDHNLGDSPLPEGKIMVYGRSRDNLTYVGDSDLYYIPVDQEAELELGMTEDVIVNAKLMKTSTSNFSFDRKKNINGWNEHQDWTLELKNTRPVAVKLEITRDFNSNKWDITVATKGVSYEKHNLSSARFTLELKPFESKEINYKLVRYHGVNKN